MLTNKEILLHAFTIGRGSDPAYPELQNLDQAAVDKMTGDEKDAKLLIKSLQESDVNMFPLVEIFHSRPLNANGEIGPATQALAQMRRCPIPDFAPLPTASFHYDDPELQKVVESYQRFAEAYVGGRGGWPVSGCDPEHKNIHSIRVGIDTSRAPANWKRDRDKILQSTIDCLAEQGMHVRYILDQAGADIEASVKFENIPGSVIGYCYFPSPDTCNQTISCRLDIGYDPSDYKMHANLDVHEYLGHGVGLEHTRGGIMNPSILLVWPLTYKGDPSESAMRRLYGGVPIGPTGPQDNPPINGTIYGEQNSSGGISLRGHPELILPANFPAGKYKYSVEPASITGQYKLVKKIEV